MTQREITLADILACLKEQKEEIKEAKDETTNRLDKFMTALENNISKVRKDVCVLNSYKISSYKITNTITPPKLYSQIPHLLQSS